MLPSFICSYNMYSVFKDIYFLNLIVNYFGIVFLIHGWKSQNSTKYEILFGSVFIFTSFYVFLRSLILKLYLHSRYLWDFFIFWTQKRRDMTLLKCYYHGFRPIFLKLCQHRLYYIWQALKIWRALEMDDNEENGGALRPLPFPGSCRLKCCQLIYHVHHIAVTIGERNGPPEHSYSSVCVKVLVGCLLLIST